MARQSRCCQVSSSPAYVGRQSTRCCVTLKQELQTAMYPIVFVMRGKLQGVRWPSLSSQPVPQIVIFPCRLVAGMNYLMEPSACTCFTATFTECLPVRLHAWQTCIAQHRDRRSSLVKTCCNGSPCNAAMVVRSSDTERLAGFLRAMTVAMA
jgi:hypothetical protein